MGTKWSKAKKEMAARRRLAFAGKIPTKKGNTPTDRGEIIGHGGIAEAPVAILKIEKKGRGKSAVAVISTRTSGFYNPIMRIHKAINDALDPKFSPSPVRTLADMSPEEIKALKEKFETRKP